MENKNQNALTLLWLGKDGNIMESLLFAIFLFAFSFLLSTAPVASIAPGVDVVATTANGIGSGYEQVIRRLDRNIVYLPEVVYGAQVALSGQWETMQQENTMALASIINGLQHPELLVQY